MTRRLTFFSGGTALKAFSQYLASKDIPSVHFISTFDSGGSSAQLRKSFAMPAVGDLRNRLLALSRVPNAVRNFCNLRLAKTGGRPQLFARLRYLARPGFQIWREIPHEISAVLRKGLSNFIRLMPENFDPANASIGNLIMTGLFLESNRNLAPVMRLLSSTLNICGIILPITEVNANLGAELSDGTIIVGQHLFKSLPAPVSRLFLTVHSSATALLHDNISLACMPPLEQTICDYLQSASLICYPPGSFYSSILANLLVANVGQTISQSRAPKVFIPNSGHDPESANLSIAEQAMLIISYLKKDHPQAQPAELLNYVLIDSRNGIYPGSLDFTYLQTAGIQIIDRKLVDSANPQAHNPAALLAALQELAKSHD